MIVRIQSNKPKRDENARNFCSHFLASRPRPGTELLGRWEPKPSLQVIYNSKWPRRRRKALKSRQRRNFVILRHVGGSPAAIFHENFEITIFAPTLVCTNLLPRFFLGHRGPTITTSTYPSTNRRADIENDCRDSEQQAKT